MYSKNIVLFLLLGFYGCEKQSEYNYSGLENASLLSTYLPVDITDVKFESTDKASEQIFPSDKISLVFFGFPGCASVCPTTMASLTDELKALPKNKRNKYKVIFVNIDQEADRGVVEEFLQGYDARYIGIIPRTSDDLKTLAKKFGAFSRKALPGEKTNEKIIHSSQVYVVSPKKQWLGFYNFPILKGKIASDLSKMTIF